MFELFNNIPQTLVPLFDARMGGPQLPPDMYDVHANLAPPPIIAVKLKLESNILHFLFLFLFLSYLSLTTIPFNVYLTHVESHGCCSCQ